MTTSATRKNKKDKTMRLIPTCQQGLQDEGLTLYGICSGKCLIHLSQWPVVEENANFELEFPFFLLFLKPTCKYFIVMFHRHITINYIKKFLQISINQLRLGSYNRRQILQK